MAVAPRLPATAAQSNIPNRKSKIRYPTPVSFYYGSSKPPNDDDRPAGFKETLMIIWVVFQALALPLGILFGGIAYLILLFVLFTISPFLGLAGIGLVVAGLVGYGVWEAKHPPELP